MWFRSLRIVNVGPFKDKTLTFTKGSVGIFGRNGAGKSTILNLLYALPTNDFSRFDGVKTDMINNTADSKAEAFIQGEIEHNGVVLNITRNFKPTKARPNTVLVLAGETLTNSDKAQEEIERVLGVERKLLDLYVFKEQHKVYDFLTTTQSERAKAYQVLCRTEVCETIWDMLGNFLHKDKDIVTEIVDNSDTLLAEISLSKERLKALEEQKVTVSESLCEEKFKTRYEELIDQQKRLEVLQKNKTKVEAYLRASKEERDAKSSEVDELFKLVTVCRDKVDKRENKADDTRAALKSFDSYKKYRQRRQALKDAAEALQVEHSSRVVPKLVDGVNEQEALVKRLTRLEDSLSAAQEVVAVFTKDGCVSCPTCATPVQHLSEHLEKLKLRIKNYPAEIAALTEQLEDIDNYLVESAQYNKWKIGYDARLKANQEARDALKDITAPDGDEEALRAWLEKFTALEAELADTVTKLDVKEKQLTQVTANVTAQTKQLEEILQEITVTTVEPSKLEKAKRRLAEDVAATNELAKLSGEIKGETKLLESKEQELKKLKVRLKRSKHIKRMAQLITVAREVLHRDRLPRRVAQTNLARMEGDINENLSFFGEPFWIEANEELSFIVHKPGEPPQAAGRLSTGQRVVLALAFWPAVVSLWASDLGMLALDEPTANLDADNRKFLSQALGSMTAKVRGQRQLIMVTHDHDLRTSFDQVVDLGD